MTAPFDDPTTGIVFGPVGGMTSLVGGSPPAPFLPGRPLTPPWTYSHGASMAVRRAAAVAVGGFDERLGPGSRAGTGEEPDMILRLDGAGFTCWLADAPKVHHLDWRDADETFTTLMNYERGSGAWLGKAMRRDWRAFGRYALARARYQVAGGEKPVDRTGQLVGLRLQYQAELLSAEARVGPRALAAFLHGMLRGLSWQERQWL